MKKAAILLSVAAVLLLIGQQQAGSDGGEDDSAGPTAGDDESNAIVDGIETMKSYITNWPTGSEPYQQAIESGAGAYDVPVPVLAWLLWKESRYSPEIVSGARRSRVGALGIAQFMPATAEEELGSAQAALDPSQAIPGAARYLRKLFDATGTWAQALAAYNWGIGNVKRKGLDAAPPETEDYYTVILSKANAGGGQFA